MRTIRLLALAALALCCLTGAGQAQTVLINGLNNLTNTWNASTQIQLTETFCVAASNGGEYQVILTGSGAASAFTLVNGSKTLPYTVEYRDNNLAFGPVTPNVPKAGLDSSDTTPTACSGNGARGQVRVTFSATDLAAATAGAYTGTLTIRVEPI
jgi:hypothetical protein